MRRHKPVVRAVARAVLLSALAAALPGCVAAAIPAVAAAGVATTQTIAKRQGRQPQAQPAQPQSQPAQLAQAQTPPPAGATVDIPEGKLVITPLRALPPPDGTTAPAAPPGIPAPAIPAPTVPTSSPTAPAPLVVGGAEGAVLSLQGYRALWHYVRIEIGYRKDKSTIASVLLSPGSTLDAPRLETCGERPLAVLLAGDEAVPTPGMTETVAAMRAAGFTVLFSSGGPTATRFYCVVAKTGFRPGDFSPLFDSHPEAVTRSPFVNLWGAGWFLMPQGPGR